MRLLLDSHAFIWFLTNDAKLSAQADRAISGAVDVYVSHAAVWEMTIKRSIGRLKLVDAPEHMAQRSGMLLLPITLRHIQLVAGLPRHHGDPFDRMLIAQAIEEGLVLVTGDATVQRYPVAWLW
jgi:PIN domain nuclease of toxin-antitoxin system